jgi:phage/plasmid primase-like uncharacterized protein
MTTVWANGSDTVANVCACFRTAMEAAGVRTSEQIIPDGALHRIHVEGDKRGRRSGWYVLHADHTPAGTFGCFRLGVNEQWRAESMSSTARPLDRRDDWHIRDFRDKERQVQLEHAADRALQLWRQARPADPEHPYLVSRHVLPLGIRQLGDRLIIPVCDEHGGFHGIQYIYPDGEKRFSSGTVKRGHYYPIGRVNGVLAIAEGYATAASIREAMGIAVACAFDAGNLRPVAEVLRSKFPEETIVIAADDDRRTPRNPGLTSARDAAQAVGGIVAVPPLAAGEQGSDWNDFARLHGPESVRFAFNAIVNSASNVDAHRQVHVDTVDEEVRELRQTPQLAGAALHGRLGELVQLWEPFTEAHPAGILFALLTGFGAMLGREYYFTIGGVEHRANLYVMLIGATGDGRKGTAVAIARTILRTIDPTFGANISGGMSSGEGIIFKLADPPEPKSGSPAPAKDRRLLIVESEMSAPFKRMSRDGNSLSAVLRQAWDGDTLSTLTKGSGGSDAGGLCATEPHLSIIAQVNPTELRKHLGELEMLNGFANRFLFCHVERARLCPDEERPDERDIHRHAQVLGRVVRERRRVEIRLSPPAGELWRDKLYPELTAGAPGITGPLITRAAPIVRRIALIYALADGSVEVQPMHLGAARAVWQYSRDTLRNIYGDRGFSELAQRLLAAVADAGATGIDLTELRVKTGTSNIAAKERAAAIDELIGAGVLKAAQEPTAGRTRTRLRLTRFGLDPV